MHTFNPSILKTKKGSLPSWGDFKYWLGTWERNHVIAPNTGVISMAFLKGDQKVLLTHMQLAVIQKFVRHVGHSIIFFWSLLKIFHNTVCKHHESYPKCHGSVLFCLTPPPPL